MAFKSKFSNLLLNPGISYNVDDDGNDASDKGNTHIVEALQGSEGIDGSGIQGISKLRARTVHLLADENQRYQVSKVKRAELENKIEDEFYDPSLAKLLYEDSSEEEITDNSTNNNKSKRKPRKNNKNSNKGKSKSKILNNSKEIDQDELTSNGESDIEEEESESDIDRLNQESTQNNELSGFSFKDDGDYSKYGDIEEDEESDDGDESGEDSEDESGEDSEVESGEDNEANTQSNIKSDDLEYSKPAKRRTLYSDDESAGDASNEENENSEEEDENSDEEDENSDEEDEISDEGGVDEEDSDDGNVNMVNLKNVTDEKKKADAIVKQLDLYDKLYETRINMQKVVGSSHRLPQPAMLPLMSDQANEARAQAEQTAHRLMSCVLALQEAVLKSNPDTLKVLSNNKLQSTTRKSRQAKVVNKRLLDDDDEEITSSEDELSDDDDLKAVAVKSSNDRTNGSKCSADTAQLGDYELVLSKRHCSMTPYRNSVVAFWEERTRLLQTNTKKASNGFAAFEETFGVMVQRLLSDRDRLLRRTQLRSIHRDNLEPPVGGKKREWVQEFDEELDIPKENSGNAFEYYDTEIYDDRDFYSRYLEELLKAKMARGTAGLSVAEYNERTHMLRRQNKKVVDTKRTRERKLKYTVHNKLVHFLAPQGAPKMDDDTIDTVVTSIFGKQATA